MTNQSEQTKIESLKGIGRVKAALLCKLGVNDVNALLEFYPRDYRDWSNITALRDAPDGEVCCVKAKVCTAVSSSRTKKNLAVFKFRATDDTADMTVTIWGSPFAAAKISRYNEYLFFGKITRDFNGIGMSSPEIADVTKAGIRPVYRATEGLNSRFIENLIKSVLSDPTLCEEAFKETLPQEVLREQNLCGREEAIRNIHFPSDKTALKKAKKRLIFEEFFNFQLNLHRLQSRVREKTAVSVKQDFTADFLKLLPFSLTAAQNRAIKEALADMAGTAPMNRLLQGDVGSGKTAVAAALLYNTARNGYRGAMMAPTEILAKQHYNSLSKLFEHTDINISLLVGSVKGAARAEVLAGLASGEVDIVVGTHALIQTGVAIDSLGLVVTDEQHRFGVAQRAALVKKGQHPHVYVMSATPIPRSLAMILYTNGEVSVLDEMPIVKKPIETYVVGEPLRPRALNYIKAHLDKGQQGYIVCPVVEEGEGDLISATAHYETLKSGMFADYTVELLNGKMPPAKKERVMSDFADGKIDLLVATTVIEVGIDVHNANIMVIENAERFGLSQLHQLRGRVGRGELPGTCILVSNAKGEVAKARFEVMKNTTDGFKIAEEDLKLRGPGDFFGYAQHGLPQFKIADIARDIEILRTAQRAVRVMVN